MLEEVAGIIIKALQDDSAVAAIAAERVFPIESEIGDQLFPLVGIETMETGRIAGANAIEVAVNLRAFAATRSECLKLYEACKTALDQERITGGITEASAPAVPVVNYSGVLRCNEPVATCEWDTVLKKFVIESEWDGKFIEQG